MLVGSTNIKVAVAVSVGSGVRVAVAVEVKVGGANFCVCVAAALEVNTMAVSGAFESKVGMAGAGVKFGITHAPAVSKSIKNVNRRMLRCNILFYINGCVWVANGSVCNPSHDIKAFFVCGGAV